MLALLLHAAPSLHAAPAGFADRALYQNASALFVGAQAIESFSSASVHGPSGGSIKGHGLPAPEALCNCACYAEDNFAYCRNTAKTTVGVSTFAWNPFSSGGGRWEGRALRYFTAGSAGIQDGRVATNFLEQAVLPSGPGGPVFFEVAYTGDVAADEAASTPPRSAEMVRGFTGAVSCDAAPLCDAQCAGYLQYADWRAGCAKPRGARGS